jgi:hypothetical protein
MANRLPKFPRPHGAHQALSPVEARKLLDAPEGDRLESLFVLALATACVAVR